MAVWIDVNREPLSGSSFTLPSGSRRQWIVLVDGKLMPVTQDEAEKLIFEAAFNNDRPKP